MKDEIKKTSFFLNLFQDWIKFIAQRQQFIRAISNAKNSNNQKQNQKKKPKKR